MASNGFWKPLHRFQTPSNRKKCAERACMRIHTRKHTHTHTHTDRQTFEFFVQNGRAGTARRDIHRCVLHLGQKALHPRSMPHAHVQLVYTLCTRTLQVNTLPIRLPHRDLPRVLSMHLCVLHLVHKALHLLCVGHSHLQLLHALRFHTIVSCPRVALSCYLQQLVADNTCARCMLDTKPSTP